MDCLSAVLTTVAHRLNQSVHTGAANAFPQLVEQIARRQTSECCDMKCCPFFEQSADDSECLALRGSILNNQLANGKSIMDRKWRFTTSKERINDLPKQRSEVDKEGLLNRNYIPNDTHGFAVKRVVGNMELAESWFDRMFISGRVYWDDKKNRAKHVCQACVPLSKIIAEDLAVRTWLELLHCREVANKDGKIVPVYKMSTSWVTYRDINATMTKLSHAVFGFDGEMQLGSEGKGDSMKTRLHRAFIQGQWSLMRYELYNLTGIGLVKRLDLHAESKEDDTKTSPLRRLQFALAQDCGGQLLRHRREKFSHRWLDAPMTAKDLLKLTVERAAIVTEGIYLVCTQLFGLSCANVVLRPSAQCPEMSTSMDPKEAAKFFAVYNWHRRPDYDDFQLWSGSKVKGSRREVSAYKGTVIASDVCTVEWGLVNLEPLLCKSVM